jgi:hypothetical protein
MALRVRGGLAAAIALASALAALFGGGGHCERERGDSGEQ